MKPFLDGLAVSLIFQLFIEFTRIWNLFIQQVSIERLLHDRHAAVSKPTRPLAASTWWENLTAKLKLGHATSKNKGTRPVF